MTAYTVEVYKKDARAKSGEKLMGTHDYTEITREKIKASFGTTFPAEKYRFEIHETIVTRNNFMSGKEFQERYDTPRFCSPSSETFWSM